MWKYCFKRGSLQHFLCLISGCLEEVFEAKDDEAGDKEDDGSDKVKEKKKKKKKKGKFCKNVYRSSHLFVRILSGR